jgi:hypothetical protein
MSDVKGEALFSNFHQFDFQVIGFANELAIDRSLRWARVLLSSETEAGSAGEQLAKG